MGEEQQVVFNGINGTSGQYLQPPTTVEDLYGRALGEGGKKSREKVGFLRGILQKLSPKHLGLPLGIEPEDVARSGWGVVFHEDESEEVKAALEPLIDHRRQRAGGDGSMVRVFDYRDGESRAVWLARHGVGDGFVEPKKVPFYLLLAGNPDRIPFDFGQQLDVEYAVGRIGFDTADDYLSYARSVVLYESDAALRRDREVVFFGPRHDFDRATQMSADDLVRPLAADGFVGRYGHASRDFIGRDARHEVLDSIFHDGKRPALLFTASHGMGFPDERAKQRDYQGAILCQDWPGLGDIAREHYFSAADIRDDAHLHGMVVFQFACYGGGTPQRDRFVHVPGQLPPEIADGPFFSALPKRLLSHRKGGALAVIAHVDRAWGYSIATPGAGTQLGPFVDSLSRILFGQPLAMAMENFNLKYAALSTTLAGKLERIGSGQILPHGDIASDWIQRNDAEGYIIFGDPAVRLHADGAGPAGGS